MMATKTVIKTNMPQIHEITIINDHDKLMQQQQKHFINKELVENVEPKIRIYQKNIDIPTIKSTATSKTSKTTIHNNNNNNNNIIMFNDAEEEAVLKKMSQKSHTSTLVASNNNNNKNNNNIKSNNNNKNDEINNNDDDNGYAVGSQELETGCTANNLSINTNVDVATKTIEYPYLMLKVGYDIQTSTAKTSITTTTTTTTSAIKTTKEASLLSTVGCESSERPKTAVSVNAMVATPLMLGDCYNEAKENVNNDDRNIHHNNYVESNGICIYNINSNNNNNKYNNSIIIDEKSKSNFIYSGQTLSISESVRDLHRQQSWSPSQREQQPLDSGNVAVINDNTNNNDDHNDDDDNDVNYDGEKASKGDCISVALTECKEPKDKIHVVKIQIPCSQESTKQHRQLEIVQHSNCVDQLKSTDNNNITKQCVTVVQLNEDNTNNNNNNNSINNFVCNKKNINNLSDINLDILHANNNLPLGIDSMVQKTQINGVNAVSVNGGGIVSNTGGTTVTELNVTNPNYLYYMMSSGQFSPCDTLDSGTCSDLESNGHACHGGATSSKEAMSHSSNVPKLELHLKTTKIRVNNSNAKVLEHQRASSLTDSEESEASSLSCDSLHSSEFPLHQHQSHALQTSNVKASNKKLTQQRFGSILPDSLLRDIRGRKSVTSDDEAYENLRDSPDNVSEQDYVEVETAKLMQERKNANNSNSHSKNNITTSSKINKRASMPSKTFIINQENGIFEDTKMNSMPRRYEADKYYDFHVKEHENFHSFDMRNNEDINPLDENIIDNYFDTKSLSDESFAGYKDIRCRSAVSTIRSSKGTVRGVKNRVRNGIATFLQLQQPLVKSFKEKDIGKVVLYTTSMGIIRDTYAKCSNVKQILRTLLVKFEERDVFMSIEYQQEIKERMQSDIIKVPQLFVEGQHIGDAETVERLNESGELRQLLKPYKSISTTYTCQTCGGYRLLPCSSCNGSKKSVHRNHFTAEFVALKCMNCDEVGLVKCHNC